MANTTTLAQLRTTARRRADMENSTFVSDAELNDYINDAGSELYDLLVTMYRQYFHQTTTVTLVANTEAYSLPTDIYKLLAVNRLEGGVRYPLEQFMLDELPDWEVDRLYPVLTGEVLRYRILGNQIYFAPKPTAGGTIELHYVPQYTKLTGDPDVVNYAFVNGWERFISIHAAIEMRSKEESPTDRLERNLAKVTQLITEAAANRDAGKPQRIRDITERPKRVGLY